MLVGVTWQKPTGIVVGVEPVASLCSQQLHCGSGMLDHQLLTNKTRQSRNFAIEMVYKTFEEELVGFEPEKENKFLGSSGDTHRRVHNTHTRTRPNIRSSGSITF
jgi:hypothetical protein